MITIENCKFSYACPKKWEFLERIDGESDIRFCRSCERKVYYCNIDDQLMERVRDGQCVAIARTVDPSTKRKEIFLGDVSYGPYEEPSALRWD